MSERLTDEAVEEMAARLNEHANFPGTATVNASLLWEARHALRSLAEERRALRSAVRRSRYACDCNSPRNVYFGTACKLCRDIDAILNAGAASTPEAKP